MKSPRIQVSIRPEVYEHLQTISRLGGKSMSSILGDMVDGAAPTLHQMADTMKQLQRLSQSLPGATAQEIAGHFDRAAWMLSGGVGEAQDHLDQVQQRLAAVDEEAASRSAAGGKREGVSSASKQRPEGPKPPYINKGVSGDPRD